MRADVADQIIGSRLLVVQSKRLMLSSARRRLDRSGGGARDERVERLARETAAADRAYRSAIFKLGSPYDRVYWVVAYDRLAQVGRTLLVKLRAAASDLPPAERYEVSADAEMLEEIVARWTESMRGSMAAATV